MILSELEGQLDVIRAAHHPLTWGLSGSKGPPLWNFWAVLVPSFFNIYIYIFITFYWAFVERSSPCVGDEGLCRGYPTPVPDPSLIPP